MSSAAVLAGVAHCGDLGFERCQPVAGRLLQGFVDGIDAAGEIVAGLFAGLAQQFEPLLDFGEAGGDALAGVLVDGGDAAADVVGGGKAGVADAGEAAFEVGEAVLGGLPGLGVGGGDTLVDGSKARFQPGEHLVDLRLQLLAGIGMAVEPGLQLVGRLQQQVEPLVEQPRAIVAEHRQLGAGAFDRGAQRIELGGDAFVDTVNGGGGAFQHAIDGGIQRIGAL